MIKISQKAQSVVEYTTIIVLVIAGILTMGPYVIRSINAHFKLLDEGVKESFQEQVKQSGDRFPGLPLCECETADWCGSADGSDAPCTVLDRVFRTTCTIPGCNPCPVPCNAENMGLPGCTREEDLGLAGCTEATLGQPGCQNCCLVNECQKSLPPSMQRPAQECRESPCCCGDVQWCADGQGQDLDGDGEINAQEDLMECCGVNSRDEIERWISAEEQVGCNDVIIRRPMRADGQVGCEDGEVFTYEQCGGGKNVPNCRQNDLCRFQCEGEPLDNAHWCEPDDQVREAGLPRNFPVSHVNFGECDPDVRCQAECEEGLTFVEGRGCIDLYHCKIGGTYEINVHEGFEGRQRLECRVGNPFAGGRCGRNPIREMRGCPAGFQEIQIGGFSPAYGKDDVRAKSWTEVWLCIQCGPLPPNVEPEDAFPGYFMYTAQRDREGVWNVNDTSACAVPHPFLGDCSCPPDTYKTYLGTVRNQARTGDTVPITSISAWAEGDTIVVKCSAYQFEPPPEP